MQSISPKEISQWLNQHRKFQLVDVREDWERDIVHLPDTHHLELEKMMNGNIGELDSELETVVYCHTGGRSAFAGEVLQRMGFSKVYNLEGGTEGYRMQIDRSLKTY